MSDSMIAPANTQLLVSVEEALARATRFGKSMVAFSRGGATHERIGVIERVARDAEAVRLSGAQHACRIVPAAIASIEVDRSSRMKDQVYPRLNFRDTAGATLFAVVGFEGLERFNAALADCREATLPSSAQKERSAPAAPATAAPPPLPFDPLQAAQRSGAEVVICHGAEGFTQEWRGAIGHLKPAMGFINILEPDFHLHLKDGSLSAWRQEEGDGREITFAAIDTEGKPTGLVISGPASAFGDEKVEVLKNQL